MRRHREGMNSSAIVAEAEKLAPQLQGDSYLAVEELVAIVDTSSRKIVTVMQRMRRQENTKAVP
jgi:hypothetical protein